MSSRPTDGWCSQRPLPTQPSCELPSPFKSPNKPDEWCEQPDASLVKALRFLLRASRR